MKEKTIYALGFFDGVHLGHQALLEACCRLAQVSGAQSAAITFLQHPQALFTADPPLLINTVEDRKTLLKSYGIRDVYALAVTKEVMSTPWEIFLEQLTEQGAAGFVCGDDFRFGNKGEGNAEKLKDYCAQRNMPWQILPEQLVEGTRVSSTYIRSLLEQGDMEQATRFLGHPHILTGTVLHGRGLGRTIGIPTANLALPENVICPRHGVYACEALVDGKQYQAVTNIGSRPTVGGHHVTVEPWLLDFADDLYGRQITLRFYAFLRPEKKFDSLEALQAQIRADAAETRQLLR